ncbi:MAG TPA: hypothetical protein VKT77_01985 [Chthonomonadaceae bacterium]|nr:hypothetical protein [Chthonomonadaceae bacterium]
MNQELMTSIESNHTLAMEYAESAHEARRRGDSAGASQKFADAFLLEKQAAEAMAPFVDIEPTRSILLRSAASLALECKRDDEAERLACLGLSGTPPVDIKTELRDVLMMIWKPATR